MGSERRELSVGEIVGAHGIRGEVKVRPDTDFPERLTELPSVWLVAPNGARTQTRVEQARPHKGGLLVKLDKVSDRTAAEKLRGYALHIDRSLAAPLDEGQFLVDEVIGLVVVTVAGEEVGPVTEVLRTGANDVYVTRRGLIPAIQSVIREIDRDAGRIVIEPMEGMLQER
jgi:16S rRNA processing protein RimM